MSAIRAGNLGRDVVRHRLAWGHRGLRPIPVPPANEGTVFRPSGTGRQHDTKSDDYFASSKCTHWFVLISCLDLGMGHRSSAAGTRRWDPAALLMAAS